MWSTNPLFPNNGAHTYAATVDSGDVTLNQDIIITQLALGPTGSPTLRGTNTVNVNANVSLNQGLLTGGAILNAKGATIISKNVDLYGWLLNLSGLTTWSGRLGVGNVSVIDNLLGATLGLSGGAIGTSYVPGNDSGNPNAGKRILNNHGTINCNAGTGSATLDLTLNNYGNININSGSLVISNGGSCTGNITVAQGAILDFERSNFPTSGAYNFTAASSIAGAGSAKFNDGTVTLAGAYNIGTATTVGNSTVTFSSSIASLGSALIINGQFALADLGANSVILNTLNLRNGTITGSKSVTVNGVLEWNDGSMRGTGMTIANAGVFFNGLNSSSGFDTLDRELDCYANSSVQTTAPYFGNLYFGLNAALKIMPGALFKGSHLAIQGSSTSGQTNGKLTNYGTLMIDDSGANKMAAFGIVFENRGAIQITNGALDVRSTIDPGAAIDQESGSIVLINGTVGNSVEVKSGSSLSGYGSTGAIICNGLLAPAGGTLNFFQSPLTLQNNSVLAYELDGSQAGVSYGQLTNVGTAALGGALQIRLGHGFQSQISSANTFTLMSVNTFTGQFANVATGNRLRTADGRGSFQVDYSGTSLVLSNFQPNAFADWASVFFTPQQLNDPAISGPQATPQNDDVPNLLKYLCDINPSVPMTGSDKAGLPYPNLLVSGGSRYLTLIFRKNPLVTGITINLETSLDLQSWQKITPDLNQIVGYDPVTGDPMIQLGVDVTGTTARFVRLSVSQP